MLIFHNDVSLPKATVKHGFRWRPATIFWGEAFPRMKHWDGKITAKRHFQCRTCGYLTCFDMADHLGIKHVNWKSSIYITYIFTWKNFHFVWGFTSRPHLMIIWSLRVTYPKNQTPGWRHSAVQHQWGDHLNFRDTHGVKSTNWWYIFRNWKIWKALQPGDSRGNLEMNPKICRRKILQFCRYASTMGTASGVGFSFLRSSVNGWRHAKTPLFEPGFPGRLRGWLLA